ncbi:hypothetical protein BKI52_30025 [marine bacterium AO1-C]|nr:hypothetical protein BKI52_30025 [marine bacterium AO1-C]
MKKTISLFAMLLISIFYCYQTSYAQQANGISAEQKAKVKAQIAEDIAKLSLNDGQKKSYKDITIKYVKQFQGLKNSSSGRFAKYRKFKSIISAKNKEMKKVLSKPQYQIYLDTQEKRIEEMKSRQ